jgi:hypothetical protein
MTLKRFTLFAVCLLLVLGWSATASATKKYSVAAGSGAQLHIGNGLALPIQTAVPACLTADLPCTRLNTKAWPPVLGMGPAVIARIVEGTTAMATGQLLKVPAGALSRRAAQATVGVFFSNPGLYAVAASLDFQWPAENAIFSVSGGPRPSGSAAVTFTGDKTTKKVRYSPRVAGKRFGGAGGFELSAGAASSESGQTVGPVTVYGVTRTSVTSSPPCTHVALVPPFPGPGGPGCKALLLNAFPTGTGVIGASPFATVTTPGGPAPATKGIFVGKFGPGFLKPGQPAGTVSAGLAVPPAIGATIMAASTGFPWTTAMLTISAMDAAGNLEKFILSGGDARAPNGSGIIQMVSGSVSTRNIVGDNANRGWVQLNLAALAGVPALAPVPLAATAGLLLLLGGYALRKRLFA